MADIDKISVNNTTYNIKDSTARESISRLVGYGAYNINEMLTTGMFFCSSASTNTPSNTSGAILVFKGSGDNALQVFFSNEATVMIYKRRMQSGVWSSWTSVS